jgi:hypothetical protein
MLKVDSRDGRQKFAGDDFSWHQVVTTQYSFYTTSTCAPSKTLPHTTTRENVVSRPMFILSYCAVPSMTLTWNHFYWRILQACCTGGQCMRFSRVACHYSMSILLHHWIIFAFMSWMGAWMGAMMQTEWWPKQPLVVYVRKWTRVT